MASSSKDILSLVPSGKKAPNVAAEKIDERILRLLGIEAFEVEMDYDTYKDALREFMARGRASKTEIPSEEVERVTNEWKRVKSKKGRFRTKVKKIKAENIKTAGKGGVGAKTTIVSAQKLLPGTAASTEKKNPFQGIKDSLDNIANLFKERNKFDKKEADNEEKDAKRSRRQKLLGGLKKGAAVIAKAADKILTPVKSVFQKLIEFFIKMFLARALIKILGWFGNPQNKKKVDAIFRFLGDHWPKLLTLYLAFGTGLGRFSVWLIKKLSWGAVKLIAVSAKLIAAAGGKKWGTRIAGLLGGRNGKLLKGLVTSVAVGGGLMAASGTIESFAGGGDPGPPPAQYAGGGLVRGFSGGGFLKTMFGGMGKGGGFKGGLKGAALGGALFGPLGMFLGAGLGSGGFHKLLGKGEEEEPSSSLGGFVSGEEGPDKVPAMLTAGEFVMSKGAVQKYGVAQMEAMNAAGGGTNVPKMVSGTTFAKGGGHIGPTEHHDAPAPGEKDPLAPKEDKKDDITVTKGKEQKESPGAWYKNKEGQIYIWQAPMSGSQGFWMKSNEPGVGKEIKKPKKDAIKVEPKINMNLPSLGGGGGGTDSLTEQAKVKTWHSAIRDFLSGDDGKSRREREAIIQNAKAKFLLDNVMAPKDGKMGYLNKNTGEWTRADWNNKDKQRYTEKGGDLTALKPQGFMRGLAGLGDIFGLGLTDFDRRGSQKLGGIGFDPISGGVDKQWGSERNLSKELQIKKESQARLDKLSNEGRGELISGEWHDAGGTPIKSEVRSKGKRFDAEDAARKESIQKRGGWWGQLARVLVTDRGYTDNKGNWRDLDVEDKAATARIKQAGAAAIGKYYSSSDGKYYGSYQEALDAREKRLAVLAKEQAAAKKKPEPPKALAKGGFTGTKNTIPGPPLRPPLRVTPSNMPNVRFQGSSDRSGQSSGPPIINASSGSPERRRLPQKIGL